MPCIPMANAAGRVTTIVCFSQGPYRLRLSDGRHVYMEWHKVLGPTLYRDRLCSREIEDWWEDDAICDAIVWFQKRGHKA